MASGGEHCTLKIHQVWVRMGELANVSCLIMYDAPLTLTRRSKTSDLGACECHPRRLPQRRVRGPLTWLCGQKRRTVDWKNCVRSIRLCQLLRTHGFFCSNEACLGCEDRVHGALSLEHPLQRRRLHRRRQVLLQSEVVAILALTPTTRHPVAGRMHPSRAMSWSRGVQCAGGA